MPITPESGFATFEAPMSHETFGGNVNKRNYGEVDIVDPTTDTSAEQGVEACRVLARAQWMMPFAELEITVGTDTPTSSVNSYVGQNGVGLSYAPTITWLGTGHVQLQWDATYADEYGVTGTLAITRVKGNAVGTSFANVVCAKVDARTVYVFLFDDTGGALNGSDAVIQVGTMGDT